jgi:hypothetical protein
MGEAISEGIANQKIITSRGNTKLLTSPLLRLGEIFSVGPRTVAAISVALPRTGKGSSEPLILEKI